MIYLETERLILKPHSMRNLVQYHAWEEDPELNYLSSDEPEDRRPDLLEETRKVMERLIKKGDLTSTTIHYAIHLREGDRFIGNGMIAFVDRYHRHCRLGISISDKTCWGRGFGKELLTAVIDFCFERLGMHRIQAEVYALTLARSVCFRGWASCRKAACARMYSSGVSSRMSCCLACCAWSGKRTKRGSDRSSPRNHSSDITNLLKSGNSLL